MQRGRAQLHAIIKTFVLSAFFTFCCYVLQNSSTIISFISSTKQGFSRVSSGQWVANLENIPSGTYYISVGRPRSLCSLSINGKIVDSTISEISGLRSQMGLGAAFSKSADDNISNASIFCAIEEGFAPGLNSAPLVLPYHYGVLLQLWRNATELLLGIFGALILILSMVFRKRHAVTLINPLWPHYFFGISSLFYSVSLAHFPRLFLGGLDASVLHTVLRAVFGLSFYLLCSHYIQTRISIVLSYLGLISLYLYVGFYQSLNFESFYDCTYFSYFILTAVAVWDLFRSSMQTRSSLFIRYIVTTWLLVQMMDISSLYLNSGSYMAPSVVALMTVMVAILKNNEDSLHAKIGNTHNEALHLINGSSPIESKLKDLGALVLSRTNFTRVSVYADAYVLGAHDRPYERFVRVMDQGYAKDVEKDKLVEFEEGRGLMMKEAFGRGEALLQQSLVDGSWFCNVPMGSHAILNLSDVNEKEAYLAHESFETINCVLPALQSLSSRLAEFGSRLGYALESLRLIRGDGTWSEEIGSIFLDVNDYDDNMQLFQEPYGNFIGKMYLPALCQRVRKWAVREGNSVGDAVYLICIQDLMQEKCSIHEAVYKTLVEVMKFVEGEGAEMCRLQGYPVVRIQIGANAGIANVTCDSFQVRTSGRIVNEAARLQKAGFVGGTFIHADMVSKYPSNASLIFEESIDELKKTRRLKGCRVHLRKTSNNAA